MTRDERAVTKRDQRILQYVTDTLISRAVEITALTVKVKVMQTVVDAAQRWVSETGPGMHVNTVTGRRLTVEALANLHRNETEETIQ